MLNINKMCRFFCIFGILSLFASASMHPLSKKINSIKIHNLRNERVKKLIYSEKYKKVRMKIKKMKTKIKSWYYDSVTNYYSLSEEERMLIDTITDLLYN